MKSKVLLSLVLVSAVACLLSSAQADMRRAEPRELVNHLVIGGCKDTPTYPDPDSIIITVSGHNITVVHADAFYNCCFEITTAVVQTGDVIDIYEHTSGTPCYCMYYFEVATTIYDLDPGTYTINVYNADGDYVGGGSATVEETKGPDSLQK